MIYDLIILGAGPAGLTSAIYSGRYNMKTAIIADNFGGTGNTAGEVENWPGMIGEGPEIMSKIVEQAKQFGAEFITAGIESVEKNGEEFVVKYPDNEIRGKTLIITLGTKHRTLGIPGEKEFIGKGVSYCATCDGNFFRNKKVAIIGGADSAAKAAVYLGDIAEKVYLVYRGEKLRAEPINQDKIDKNEKIEFINFNNPTEISGENVVKKLKIKNNKTDEERELEVDGVFIEIGADPLINIVEKLNLELDKGYIKTDKSAKTSIEGVFAAGDITDIYMKQMITASGEGATAAKAAYDYLMSK